MAFYGCGLPQKNPNRARMHTLERQADQLRAAGIWPDAPIRPGSAPPADLSWILDRKGASRPMNTAGTSRPYVLFVPGTSAHRPEKRWPVERFGELGVALRKRGLEIIVIGGPQESGLARAIQRQVQARDLTGRTDFAQIAALAARATLAVGNLTPAPCTLIAAAGAPTIAALLFGLRSDALRPARPRLPVMQADNLGEAAGRPARRPLRGREPVARPAELHVAPERLDRRYPLGHMSAEA